MSPALHVLCKWSESSTNPVKDSRHHFILFLLHQSHLDLENHPGPESLHLLFLSGIQRLSRKEELANQIENSFNTPSPPTHNTFLFLFFTLKGPEIVYRRNPSYASGKKKKGVIPTIYTLPSRIRTVFCFCLVACLCFNLGLSPEDTDFLGTTPQFDIGVECGPGTCIS